MYSKMQIASALIDCNFSDETIVQILDKLDVEKVAEARRIIAEFEAIEKLVK